MAGLAAVGAVALKLLFPPDALRALAVPQIERRVGRQVAIEAVSLKVFPRIAIRLSGVQIPNPPGFSADPTVRLDALDIELRLWPLLRKQFVFNQVLLRSPTIRYEVAADGTTNLAGLGQVDTTAAPRSGGGATDLLVSDFRLLDGTVIYQDARNGQAARFGIEAQASLDQVPGRAGIESNGEITLRDIRALTPRAGADSLAIPDSRIRYTVITDPVGDSVVVTDLSVTIGTVLLHGAGAMRSVATQKAVDLELVSDVIDLAEFIGGLPPGLQPEGLAVLGRATVTLRALGQLAQGPLDVGGTIHLEDVSAEHAEYGAFLSGAGGELTFDRSSIHSPALRGMLWDRPLTLEFRLSDFADPTVTGRATGSVALARLPSQDSAAAATGDAAFDIAFSGPAKQPGRLSLTGPIELTDVVYHSASLAVPARIARAAIQLTGAGVVANSIPIRLGKSDATVTLRSASLVPYLLGRDSTAAPAPVTFTLTSTLLDLGEVLPDTSGYGYGNLVAARLAGKPLQGQDPGAIARQRYRVPSRPRARVDGRVQLAEVVNPPSRGRNIVFDVRLADGVLEVKNLTGQLYDGTLSGGFTLDLRPSVAPYPLRYAIQLRDAQSSDFLSRWTRLASAISGTVDFDIDGVAALDDGLLPQVADLAASGNSNFKDGQFQEFGPARALVDRLQLQGPERSTFKQLGGIFKIEGGALVVDDWSYRGTEVSGAINGSAALDGGLDLSLALQVPPAVLSQAGLLQGGGALASLTRQLSGSDQTLELTVGVGGTVSAPVLRVDTDGLQKELERRLAGEGRGLLDRVLKPQGGQPAPSP